MENNTESGEPYDEISCGGVPVYYKNDELEFLLLLHNSPYRYWAFPKGRQNQEETYEQTAIREISEETGNTNFKIQKRLISDSIYFPKRGLRTIIKRVVFFLVRFYDKQITLSPEHISWKWVDYDTALSLLTFDDYKRVLKESSETLEKEGLIK